MKSLIKLGLVSISFRKFSPRKVVNACVKAGLQGIEWGGDTHVPHGNIKIATEVQRMTADAGLEIPCYGSYYRAGWNSPDNPDFKAVLDSAQALHTPMIRIWAGRAGSDEVTPLEREHIVAAIHDCVQQASAVNLTVALEYHGNTLTDTFESTVDLLSSFEHPNFKTLWQPRRDSDMIENLEALKALEPRLANLHVFHWLYTDAGRERMALAEGREIWNSYLNSLKDSTTPRYALLEFIKNDSVDQLCADAAVLRELIRRL